jgi:anti-sigma-K factor RskA
MPDVDPGFPHVDVAGHLLGALTSEEEAAFEVHIATCPACRQELEELRRVPDLLAVAAEPVEVPAGLEARVLDAIAREPARRRAPTGARTRLQRSGPGPRWRGAWGLAAAAALVIAFFGGIGLGRGLPQSHPPAPVHQPVSLQTIHLVAAAGGTGSGVATVRDTAAGKAIELTVKGLPPPPAGHFYTCWLVAGDDTLQHQDRVSVGSFRTSGTGSVTLRWETAADLGRYPHLGVTLEPDTGNPLHQGPKVLVATG